MKWQLYRFYGLSLASSNMYNTSNVIVNDSVRRDALTPENERKFLKFIKEDRHLYLKPKKLCQNMLNYTKLLIYKKGYKAQKYGVLRYVQNTICLPWLHLSFANG
ncbi:hypothetical protein SAMN04487830_101108 [Pseudobutyrivibrio sp. OR37]|nr:hypothetical protein SAMN04487830_101108 [Pseudobutyrivibrio sp. OR37]